MFSGAYDGVKNTKFTRTSMKSEHGVNVYKEIVWMVWIENNTVLTCVNYTQNKCPLMINIYTPKSSKNNKSIHWCYKGDLVGLIISI